MVFGLGKERRCRRPQSAGDSDEIADANVVGTSLDPADVVAMQTCVVSEFLLGHADLESSSADDIPERVVDGARARHARSVSAP